MLAQGQWNYKSQGLCGKINVHIVQHGLIVEEGMMATLGICFRKREASMFQEIQLSMSNFTCKVRALAHLRCNGEACFEAWLFGYLAACLVLCVKFDILCHSSKEGK